MKFLPQLFLIYFFISIDVSYSQRNIPKTLSNQNGKFVESISRPGGARKKGVMTFANGDKIIGEWRNDTLWGLAKIIYKDGFVEQGKWSKGTLKKKYDILEFYKDGTIKEECVDKVNGESNLYNVVGNPSSIKYYENSKLKYERFWNEYNDGFKKIVNYDLLGKVNGEYITYNIPIRNGENSLTVSIDTIGQYLSGKRVGEWKKKYPGSNLDQSVFIYQDGNLTYEVQYRYYEEKNNKYKESFFKDNKKLKVIFYTYISSDEVSIDEEIYNGNIKTENHYYNGKLILTKTKSSITNEQEGIEICYFNNGNVKYKSLYKNGDAISQESYYENGNKKHFFDSKKVEDYDSSGNLIKSIDKTTNKAFFLFNNGDKYIGQYNINTGKREGKGEYHWSNGNKEVGNYKDDKIIGIGTKYWADGDKYIGMFDENGGIADGKGEYHWSNGNKYVGNFKDRTFNGYGKIINVDGSIQEGIFSNGNLVNDYNKKQISSSNTSNKSKQKKYTNPPLHLSTKELGEWFDSEEGQAYLKQSGLLNEVQKRILNPANYNSGSSSSMNKPKINGGSSPCPYCNKEFAKPALKHNRRCDVEITKTTNPGYILCNNCYGYGCRLTKNNCDCIDGIGWCYDKECESSSCDNGWDKCSDCNGTGQRK